MSTRSKKRRHPMLTIGALALDATDARTAQPPHRLIRPARRANQGARILGLFRQVGREIDRAAREAGGNLPLATMVSPR
jgi:hypothetical protein